MPHHQDNADPPPKPSSQQPQPSTTTKPHKLQLMHSRPPQPPPRDCRVQLQGCTGTAPAVWETSEIAPDGHWRIRWMCESCSAQVEETERHEREDDRQRRARIPRRLWGYSFDRVVRQAREGDDWLAFRKRIDAVPGHIGITKWNVDAAAFVRDWQLTDPIGIYLWGPVGSGKTTMIAAAANAMVLGGSDVCWLSEGELLSGKPSERAALFDRAVAVRVLVLDDLGVTSSLKAWQRDLVQDLLARRYSAARPVLVSANMPIQADGRNHSVARRYGERVASRLIEMVGGNRAGLPGYIELRGWDWRTDRRHTPSEAPPKPPPEPEQVDWQKKAANDDS